MPQCLQMTRPMLIAGAAALILAPGAFAASPRVAAGKWAVEYQADTCTLTRDGLPGEAGIAIRIRPLAELHQLMLHGPIDGPRDAQFQARVELGDGQGPFQRWVLVERRARGKPTFVKLEITQPELQRIGKARTIQLTGPAGFSANAPLPGIVKALGTLRECEVYLVGRWGISAAEMDSWARPARPTEDLSRLFWSEDKSKYGLLRSGAVRAVLDIDPAGRITACRLIEFSRVSWVDKKFCEILRARARFEPARNAAGEAVAGKVVTPPIRSMPLR